MAKKKELCRDKKGLFVRNLGWRKTPSGYSQKKFYLGRQEPQARIASLKLEQLWDAVCRRWEAATPPTPRLSSKPNPRHKITTETISTPNGPLTALHSIGVGELDFERPGKPIWDEVSLTIAEAIRNGEATVRVPLPRQLGQSGLTSPSIGQWLDQLRRDVPFIHIELLDEELQGEAESEIKTEGDKLIKRGRRMLFQGAGGETMHLALDEYIKALESKHVNLDGTVNPTGTAQVRQAQFLKECLSDCLLADLDTPRILAYQEMLALRPPGKRVKRIAVRTARNYIKQFRHFIRWLSTAPGFSWKRPSDLEFTAIRIPETVQEKATAARTSRVQTYSYDEIQILWEYASPLKRLLLLMGLNCGFDAKMIATLQPEDIHLNQEHPSAREIQYQSTENDSWIFRLRNKTSVYGEWKLWPITVSALEWWQKQRSQIEIAEDVSAFLVNQKGRAYDTPTAGNDRNMQIPNLWRGLTDKIRKDEDHSEFRKLSFGKLRKTAGNLIRVESSGEAAGVFLCHGTPVKSDDLLDFYTNRPFAKVFEAIDLVGQRLSPIWSSVESPFPEQRKRGGSNISQSKISRIKSMRRQGFKLDYIAKNLGVTKQTVSRHSHKK